MSRRSLLSALAGAALSAMLPLQELWAPLAVRVLEKPQVVYTISSQFEELLLHPEADFTLAPPVRHSYWPDTRPNITIYDCGRRRS